jgi:type I restriction enzyme R subunit
MPAHDPPEQRARRRIDAALTAAGWIVQGRAEINLSAGPGVVIREFQMGSGHGFADYLLFVDGQAVGALEAKPEGYPLTSVEPQVKLYSEGLPTSLQAPHRPLPFLYMSTGVETRFANLLDPEHRTRPVFAVHRPETLAEWLRAETLEQWLAERAGGSLAAEASRDFGSRPSTLRARLRRMPPVHIPNLWPNKIEALQNLERSFAADRPRALIQMATGSGKTLLAVTALYRLIKFAGARRVLFLVDRANLGEQAEKEFAGYRTPDDNRRFTELYNVQRLTSNTIGASTKVAITTIQRLYSMLKGEPDLDPELEENSGFDGGAAGSEEAIPVSYNPALPPEYFDFIVVDECHRSIYSLWRQALEYFDAYLIGLTATPAKHTFGFFNKNLVMEYSHEKAVADRVNVDFEVYRIRTRITEEGSVIETSDLPVLGVRDRRTRAVRWEAPDEQFTYRPQDLDRSVVAKDQIRTVVRTFKERLFTEIFPARTEVPKTLVFAKDDSHAEDVVSTIREEFGRGDQFCQKITYKTTGKKPADLIQEFRNGYWPRIAVTVDMVATGTDIKPVEIVLFLRSVQSRVLFEQMKGRGVRVIDRDALKAVTPDAGAKTHFVIVDCVGVTESDLVDPPQPLDRKKTVAFKALLEHVALGGTDPDILSSLASRLSRLDKQCGPEDRRLVEAASGGPSLEQMNRRIVDALDADAQEAKARQMAGLPPETAPSDKQLLDAEVALLKDAARTLAEKPPLRNLLLDLKKKFEQIIDEISQDDLIDAGASDQARERARSLTQSFERFLAENRKEIDALEFFYSQPYGRRLRFVEIKALAAAIQTPPRSWTPELLWRAYQILERDKVRGASAGRLLTDIVSLVRFALHQRDELVPFEDQVQDRFQAWLAQQKNRGRQFTGDQVHWLEMIRDHVATSLEITMDDFELTPFTEEGGLGRAGQVFGPELRPLLAELNEALVA